MNCLLETKYVKDVYNEIGEQFSSSRHTPWPGVKEFMMSLPKDSKILDAGCGNGKNMLIREEMDIVGCDFSQTLVDICKEKGLNVVQSNILNLPFENESFDVVICVAVLHHLSTYERRLQAVNEMLRVVKPGGKIYIEVWAYEQELTRKFVRVEQHGLDMQVMGDSKDFFVTWDNKHNRFYHLFDKSEVMGMFPNGDIRFEKDNWVIILNK